jgi:hypothetical protein
VASAVLRSNYIVFCSLVQVKTDQRLKNLRRKEISGTPAKLPHHKGNELCFEGEIAPKPLLEEELMKMKKTIVRMILVTFLLLTSGVTPVLADSTPVPVCWPGKPCATR